MTDLRPYLCTYPDCPQSAITYVSRHSLLGHQARAHSSDELKVSSSHSPGGLFKENPHRICPFCHEVFLDCKPIFDYGSHVGHHLEQIAFAVVSKPYEDWEFYSDSSRAHSHWF